MAEVDRSIPFIETHHHLWELDRFHYDWLTDPGWDGHNALLGDYKMIRSTIGAPWRFFKEFYGANVIKSVHVEAAYAGPDALEETVWLEQVGKEHGFPNALVVFCDIEADGAEAKLDQHLAASDRVRGVRIRAHPQDGGGAAFKAGYEALAKRGLSYELNASPGVILSGRDVAAANPDTQVILGHAGFPVQRDDDYFKLWSSEISQLGGGRARLGQGVRLRHGRQPLDHRLHPAVGAAHDRGLRARTDHVRDELARRHPVRHVPRTDGRLSADHRGGGVQPVRAGRDAVSQRRTVLSDLIP